MISFLLAAAFLLAQQVTAPPRAGVQGSVVNALNGEAVRKATVILRSHDDQDGMSYADETDANGHFSITDVQPGEYSVSARRQGFIFEPPGATGAPPPNLKVQQGEQIKDVVIRLTPLGVIAGRVLDADGDPVRGVSVNALLDRYVNGAKTRRSVDQAQSNGNGEFRLFGLRQGTYYLQATGQPQRNLLGVASQTTYYPGTTDAGHAGAVELQPGAELSGFDIRLQPEAAVYSVRFKLPTNNLTDLAPMIYTHGGRMFVATGVSITGDVMTLQGLQPGAYDVVIVNHGDGKQTYARQTFEIANADVDGGALNFVPAADVTGSVRVEGGAFHDLASLQLMLRSSSGASTMGTLRTNVKPDGSFRFEQAVPDVYDIAVQSRDVYVKAVRTGDQELQDRQVDVSALAGPLMVVLGADMGDVEGDVKNAAGRPVVRARVNVIADGRNADRRDLNRYGFTDEKGEFKIENVAPGAYKVFAWENVPPGAPQDPAFRKRFEMQAVPATVQPGGHAKISVTAISAAQVDRSSP